ncbi:MAG TPA: DUF4097 family beta strand repeat-containing protein, partial [Pyrinomonadaceae bacterium]
MKTKRNILTALVAVGLLLSSINGSSQSQNQSEVREEFHQTYPLAAGGRVALENIDGSVRITVWDRNEVKVDAVKRAYNRERLGEANIRINSNAESIDISTEYPERNYRFNTGDERRNSLASVDYTLTVPRTARLDALELVSGDLMIEGVTGDVKASLVNGGVTARGLMGEAKLSTVNGRLEATFDRLSEAKAISLGSVNGPLTLVIPSDSNVQLRANTVHGSISNEFGLRVRHGEYIGSDLAGTLGQGGPRVRLANVNGPISIRHASDNRPLSPVTNQLPEGKEDADDNDDSDTGARAEARDARRQARSAEREAAREAARAQVEAQRAVRESQLEGQRETREAQTEAEREAREARQETARAASEARVEAARAAREALAENSEQIREAQREAQRSVRESQRETTRVAREAERAAREATRGLNNDNNDLRLVERESKTFPATGLSRVTLNTFDGRISIRAWDKPEVTLTAIKRAGNEQALRGITVKAEQQGADINVVTDYDKSAGRHLGGIFSTNASVTLELFVPRNTNIQALSGDGRVELEGITGELNIQTGDGRIEVRDGGGHLTAKTGDGRIEISNYTGDVDAKTGDGRISLEGRFNQLAARTGDGSIQLTLPLDLDATIETDAETVNGDGLTIEEAT